MQRPTIVSSNNEPRYYDRPCMRDYGINARKSFNLICPEDCRLERTQLEGDYCCVKKTKKRVREAWLQNMIPRAKHPRITPFGKFIKKYMSYGNSKEKAYAKYKKALILLKK